MEPNKYFPDRYLADLKKFSNKEIKGNGPKGMLCGRTMGNILDPKYRGQYKYLQEFLISLYCLNLISQGICTHFNEDFYAWCEISIPFPDCQTCASLHGGISRPDSILKFAEQPSYIPGAKPVQFDMEMVNKYLQFFFLDYFSKLEYKFIHVTSDKLISALIADKDCLTFQKYWFP